MIRNNHIFKYIFTVILFLIFSTNLFARQKVAVVLSGGGAKGFAHVGALKAIEEAGIPIDYIVGTSMGSIMGGLYAIGYTTDQLDSIIRHQDWMYLFSDKDKRVSMSLSRKAQVDTYILSIPFSKKEFKQNLKGVVRGNNLEALFINLTREYADSCDFNKFPIPFACVSVDAVSGKEHVFHNGVLHQAIRASMAIPTIFTPVNWYGSILVDGGVSNNYPVDVAEAMGADVIIGVDVAERAHNTAKDLEMATSLLFQLVMLNGQEKYLRNIERSDLYIPVDLSKYSVGSFTNAATDSIMRIGHETTCSYMPQLLELKNKLGLGDTTTSTTKPCYSYSQNKDSILIYKVRFEGFNSRESKWLKNNCKIKPFNVYKREDLNKAVKTLHDTHTKADIEPLLRDTLDGYVLTFIMQERYDYSLNLGMNVDTEEIASIITNATFGVNTPTPSLFSVTARLGRRINAKGEYYFTPYPYGTLNFSLGVDYNGINIYEYGKRACNLTYVKPSGSFYFSDQSVADHDFRICAGVNVEYYDYTDTLYTDGSERLDLIQDGLMFNYFAKINYDTFDRKYFPKYGTELDFTATLHTDNTYAYAGGNPMLSVMAYWQSVFPCNSYFTIVPSVYGRFIFMTDGRPVPFHISNIMGGYTPGRYYAQQLPFEALSHLETFENSLLATGLGFRGCILKRHYITLTGNFAMTDDYIFSMHKEMIYGGALRYSYDSIVGPLTLSMGYTNRSRFGIYLHVGFMF